MFNIDIQSFCSGVAVGSGLVALFNIFLDMKIRKDEEEEIQMLAHFDLNAVLDRMQEVTNAKIDNIIRHTDLKGVDVAKVREMIDCLSDAKLVAILKSNENCLNRLIEEYNKTKK